LVDRVRAALAPLGLLLHADGGGLRVASAAGAPMGRLSLTGGAVGLLGLRSTALMVDVATALQGAGVAYRVSAVKIESASFGTVSL
jgi:hypothetical protein